MYGHLFCTSGRLSWAAVRVAYRKAALYQAGQEIYLAETALVPLIRKRFDVLFWESPDQEFRSSRG